MPGTPKLNVTFPVLNEEKQLAASVERMMDYCAAERIALHETCIADNGSTDRTGEIGKALSAKYPNVTYLSVGKRGFGLALKTAWARSEADFAGYMDVDLATDLKHLKEVHDLIRSGAGYDLYLGSRLKSGASVKTGRFCALSLPAPSTVFSMPGSASASRTRCAASNSSAAASITR
ncbi:MAG: glycosyltransferase [Rhodomicrobium sp.]|nr:glycosyltransferase [Rhodomicrobium sp.]